MAAKTAKVTVRIQPDIKENAKSISTRDILSEAEFNAIMAKGLKQAKKDDSLPVEEAFACLRFGVHSDS